MIWAKRFWWPIWLWSLNLPNSFHCFIQHCALISYQGHINIVTRTRRWSGTNGATPSSFLGFPSSQVRVVSAFVQFSVAEVAEVASLTTDMTQLLAVQLTYQLLLLALCSLNIPWQIILILKIFKILKLFQILPHPPSFLLFYSFNISQMISIYSRYSY